jgi:hypothetical protein
MLVARFNCPECDALLRPASPQPAGKRFRCPRCDGVITVPFPEDDDRDELEEAEDDDPAARRVNHRAPRRRAGRGDEEDEERSPRRSNRARKKTGRGGSGVKLAIILGAVLLGVGVLAGAGFLIVSLLPTSRVKARAQALDEATAALTGVKDQASADAAKPRLLRVAQRLRQFHEEDMEALKKGMKKLEEDPEAIKRAIEEGMKNPEKAKAQAAKAEKEQLPLREATERLVKEVQRVQKVPGGKELLASFYEAWGPGGDMVKLAAGLADWGDPGPGGKKGR